MRYSVVLNKDVVFVGSLDRLQMHRGDVVQTSDSVSELDDLSPARLVQLMPNEVRLTDDVLNRGLTRLWLAHSDEFSAVVPSAYVLLPD